MAINGLFCADVLRPLDLVPLTDFTYKYHPAYVNINVSLIRHVTAKKLFSILNWTLPNGPVLTSRHDLRLFETNAQIRL